MVDARKYYATESLTDGTVVCIRSIRQHDREGILDAFEALDPEAVYRRFFTPKKHLTDAELKNLTNVDFNQTVALVATVAGESGETLVGGGRYVAETAESPHRAEIAFLVSKAYRGRGIGSLLLRHLTRIAKEAGLSELEADVLAENAPMLAVFQRTGMLVRQRREGSAVHVVLSLKPDKAGRTE